MSDSSYAHNQIVGGNFMVWLDHCYRDITKIQCLRFRQLAHLPCSIMFIYQFSIYVIVNIGRVEVDHRAKLARLCKIDHYFNILDLSRSKSTPIMDKQMNPVMRTKRLSVADEVPKTQPANLHHTAQPSPAGMDKYRISGGISLADRMRKFT